jgi:PEP-CTERM motif
MKRARPSSSTRTGGSSKVYAAAGLGLSSTSGDQSVNQAVQFTALGGTKITSLGFSSAGNAFEVAHFSITRTVPEPGTLALLGFGLRGVAVARRGVFAGLRDIEEGEN